jgi:hypothetical protein
MRFGADAWGRLAVVPAFVLVLPWQCSLAPRRDPGFLGASVAPPEPAVPPPNAPPDRAQDPGPDLAAPPPRAPAVPPAPSAVTPKQEQPGPRVPAVPPPAPPVRAVTLRDEVVVQAIGAGQQAFLRCWARAQRSDAPPTADKVRLHLEIDEQGRVAAATSDTDSPALDRCLQVVARRLPFPPPGRPAVVDLPLMFR